MNLLGFEFRTMSSSLALSIIKPEMTQQTNANDLKENDERIN